MATLKDLADEVVKSQVVLIMEHTKNILREQEVTRKLIADYGMAKLEMLIYERLRNFAALQVARIGDEVRRHERHGPRQRR